MLRAKQIGTLSNSAKTFFLSGSRCGTADGSSCTCSEDETCISRKFNARNGILHPQKTSTLVSKTSARVGTLISGDAVKVVGSQKAESVKYPTSLPEAVSATGTSHRSNCVSYASNVDAVQKDMVQTSPLMSDQFVKAGIAAVSFLSDLANYKLPISEGSGLDILPNNCMVDPTRPLSKIKPSKVKPIKRENIPKVHQTPYPEVAAGSNLTSNYHGTKGKGDKSGTGKGFNRLLSTGAGVSETYSTCFDTRDKRRSIPPTSKPHSNHYMSYPNSNVQTSETKFVGSITDSFHKHPRDTKMHTVNAAMFEKHVLQHD